MTEGSYIVATCIAATGVGKAGSCNPSLLGRKRYMEVATKLAKNNKHPKLDKLKC